MNDIIKADLYRYGGKTSVLKGIIIEIGFRYTYFWRKACKYKKRSFLGIIYRIILYRIGFKYGIRIPINKNIAEGLYICHYGSILISENVIIGKNCNITHNTTIGQANRGKLKGWPTIGDNVWIGTGVVIVGKINIGSNVLIAPNSFVNFNVPDNSLVIGHPANIIQKENVTDSYIEFTQNKKAPVG